MKLYVTILLLWLCLSVSSQTIGDKLEYLLDNKVQFNLTKQRFTDNYLELYSFSDTVVVVYLVDYKTRKVFGVDNLYVEGDRLNKRLKMAVNDAYSIGYNIWIKEDVLIIARKDDIIFRDVQFIRSTRNRKKKQRQSR